MTPELGHLALILAFQTGRALRRLSNGDVALGQFIVATRRIQIVEVAFERSDAQIGWMPSATTRCLAGHEATSSWDGFTPAPKSRRAARR